MGEVTNARWFYSGIQERIRLVKSMRSLLVATVASNGPAINFGRKFMRISNLAASALTVMLISSLLVNSARAEPPPNDKSKDLGFPDLIAALKATPGCLGVETAKTESGKQVIFAWFEDKKAALKWYNSDAHQALIKRFFPGRTLAENPLKGVLDENAPVMAVASVTVNENPTKENPRPFKQIAIELYQPLAGGLSLGGKFAPNKMKVPEPRKSE
jgi:hypothetical protein